MTTPVTPAAGNASVVTTGGTPVMAAAGAINGGYITNPIDAASQGIATAEPLFVDPVGGASALIGNGTTTELQPGQSYQMIPGQTTPTYVNAASSGHKFTVVVW